MKKIAGNEPIKGMKIRFGLPFKLVAAFLVISLFPLILLLYLNVQATKASLEAEAYKTLFASASKTCQRLNGFIQSNLGVISAEAKLPAIASFLNLSSEDQRTKNQINRLKGIFDSLMDKNRLFLSSYALLDISGRNIFDSDSANIGADLADRIYFREALETGLPYASDVEFDQDSGRAFIYFSSPVHDSKGKMVGVLRSRYSAAVIQQIILQDTGMLGPRSFAMVVNRNNLILAYGIFSHGGANEIMFGPIKDVPEETMRALQKDRLFPPAIKKNPYTNRIDLPKGWRNATVAERYFTSTLPAAGDKIFAAAVTCMKTVPWEVAFFQPRGAFLARAEQQTQRMVYFAVMTAIFVTIAALTWAHFLSKPIRQLTKVAKRISRGDLSAVYISRSRDEIGVLANTFNVMTLRLRRRIEMEKLLSSISRRFIHLDADDFTAAIDASLHDIADFAEIDRCVLFQTVNPDEDRFVVTNEWSNEADKKAPESLQAVPDHVVSEMVSLLKQNERIEFVDTKKSPGDLAGFWRDRGSRSVLCTGFLRSGNRYGLIGFETIGSVRKWLPEEIYLLNMTGETIRSTLERLQAEKDKAFIEEQLRHSTKMEAIGTLAGGIAHDFNNLLQGVSGYVQLMLTERDENDEDWEYLEKANSALKRAAKLVQRLLTLSRRSEAKLKAVNINDIVNNTIDLLEHTIPKMVDITAHLTPKLPLVQADANQIEQVLVNMVNNAVDAMDGSGYLILETSVFHMNSRSYYSSLKLERGEYVLIQISDTGAGMDEKTREKIFDAFFTTKEVGKGTGLGLATTYNIVKDHGGHISCYSEVGKGTTFKVYLPVDAEATMREKAEGNKEKAAMRGTETLMIVDDEKDIRETSRKFLRNCGYKIYTAASAEEALSLYQSKKDKIELIVMDLGMPGMGGEKGLIEFLKRDSSVKIIIASGYSAHKIAKDPQGHGAIRFFSKPYDFEKLNKTIREILG